MILCPSGSDYLPLFPHLIKGNTWAFMVHRFPKISLEIPFFTFVEPQMKFLAFEGGFLLPVDCSETCLCLVQKLCISILLLGKQKLSLKRRWSTISELATRRNWNLFHTPIATTPTGFLGRAPEKMVSLMALFPLARPNMYTSLASLTSPNIFFVAVAAGGSLPPHMSAVSCNNVQKRRFCFCNV